MAKQRKIIHVDMDAFFASVEQRDNPEYQGKPLVVRGIDNRPVRSARMRKSLGKEITFSNDILDTNELLGHLNSLAEKVFSRLKEGGLKPKIITIKVKYANFKQVTRSRTLDKPITSLENFTTVIPKLLALTDAGKTPVRLVGFTASGFEKDKEEAKQQNTQLGLKF